MPGEKTQRLQQIRQHLQAGRISASEAATKAAKITATPGEGTGQLINDIFTEAGEEPAEATPQENEEPEIEATAESEEAGPEFLRELDDYVDGLNAVIEIEEDEGHEKDYDRGKTLDLLEKWVTGLEDLESEETPLPPDVTSDSGRPENAAEPPVISEKPVVEPAHGTVADGVRDAQSEQPGLKTPTPEALQNQQGEELPALVTSGVEPEVAEQPELKPIEFNSDADLEIKSFVQSFIQSHEIDMKNDAEAEAPPVEGKNKNLFTANFFADLDTGKFADYEYDDDQMIAGLVGLRKLLTEYKKAESKEEMTNVLLRAADRWSWAVHESYYSNIGRDGLVETYGETGKIFLEVDKKLRSKERKQLGVEQQVKIAEEFLLTSQEILLFDYSLEASRKLEEQRMANFAGQNIPEKVFEVSAGKNALFADLIAGQRTMYSDMRQEALFRDKLQEDREDVNVVLKSELETIKIPDPTVVDVGEQRSIYQALVKKETFGAILELRERFEDDIESGKVAHNSFMKLRRVFQDGIRNSNQEGYVQFQSELRVAVEDIYRELSG